MSVIQISSPFLRSFVHQDGTINTVGTSGTTEILPPCDVGVKRIITVIQNKSSSATIQVILADTGDEGILVSAGQLISLDNYCGRIRVNASADNTLIHLAYSQV